MAKRPLPAGPSLVCGRRFEPSRIQEYYWSEAYQCLAPARARAKAARVQTPADSRDHGRKKTITQRSGNVHHQGGICA